MSRFSGPQGRGAMRQIRALKRTEAALRQVEFGKDVETLVSHGWSPWNAANLTADVRRSTAHHYFIGDNLDRV